MSPNRSLRGWRRRPAAVPVFAGGLLLLAFGVCAVWTVRAAAPSPQAALTLDEAEGVSGLASGDSVTAWRRRGPERRTVAGGPLDEPFALFGVLRDQVPRGGVELRRGERWVAVPSHGAVLRAEPALSGELRAAYRRALADGRSDDPAKRRHGLAGLERVADSAGPPLARSWVLYRLSLLQRTAGDLSGAAASLETAAAGRDLPLYVTALLHFARWRVLQDAKVPEKALDEAGRAAAALAEAAGNRRVLAAEIEIGRAASLRSLGRLDESQKSFASGLATLGQLAPESAELAWALREAANGAWLADDFELAESHLRRAVALDERFGVSRRWEVGFLGILAAQTGRVAEAEKLYLEALDGADGRFRAIERGNLARLYMERGELDRARKILREVLAFYEREDDPRNTFVEAAAWGNLGEAERRLGNLAPAEDAIRRAVAIYDERSPGSITAADSRITLARILRQRGRLDDADRVLSKALEIATGARPEGLLVADAEAASGAVAWERHDLDDAERHYRRALALHRKFATGTWREARWLDALGRIEAARGHREPALRLYLESVDVVEGLRGRFGGAHEARAGFTSLFQEIYWDPVELLAASGREAEAFALLERYRAETFREELARRRLDLSIDLPDDLDRRRRRLATRYDGALRRLEAAPPEKRPERRAELDRVRLAQEEVEDRIRQASPRLAALRDPRTLDETGARALLDGRTLLLSYVVGPDGSWLFALGPGDHALAAARPPVGRGELGRQIATYRGLVERPNVRLAALRIAGATLTRELLGPVADRLRAAEHVIVLPDGPLHLLPWSALPDPATPTEPLLARHSISLAASATVLGELRARKVAAPEGLVAFGDPLGEGSSAAGPALEVALRAGSSLTALPGSRREVQALGRLFGQAAKLFLGTEVTEERLIEEASSARRLHLACHAVVDPHLPLESGLVLAPSGGSGERGNGFLQVWEIYQRLRLDADLVTLSACDTALGRDLPGEGVLGLTRAFQYAGARTVVSSLWKVSDEPSARLMVLFYRNLLAGTGKAEALRRAQLAIRGGGRGDGEGPGTPTRPPFYWAAFQVYGAWD